MNASLYICYQSITEPLTQTQVVAYLKGLARDGYRIVLLTFEPEPLSRESCEQWRMQLEANGIQWHWLPYHKRPTVPATAWDVVRGIVKGRELITRYGVRLVHARGHVPGLIGLVLKRLTGVKLLFDIRGFMAEEYADAGIWQENGKLFRATKQAERKLVDAADGIVVLTKKATYVLADWYGEPIRAKPTEVIPCCVDVSAYRSVFPPRASKRNLRFVYTGKLGGWYMDEELARFVAVAHKMNPDCRWDIWTQSETGKMRERLTGVGLNGEVTIGRVEPDQMSVRLAYANVGICFYKRNLSRVACSPTKIGEYLAAGLPVVSTAGIGDMDSLLTNSGDGPVGVLVRDFTIEAYERAIGELKSLMADPGIRERCQRVARRHLDMETVGRPRYRNMYQQLIGEQST